MLKNMLSLLLALALLNVLLYIQQPWLTFMPYKTIAQTPGDRGLEYEDLWFVTEDGVRLHGWFIPATGITDGEPKTLLFFHGNAGNISHRGASIEIFHHLGLNVFIFDYRGYGNSQGKPDEQGLYRDAHAAWRYLTEQRQIADTDIILFGRSLGGAVAAWLGAEVRPGGLILESTFSSAREMADVILPVLSSLIMLRYTFATTSHVGQLQSPVLVLHSPDDEIIPFHLGEKVFLAANEPKTFVRLRGSHNEGFLQSRPTYEHALAEFVSAL